MIHYQTNGNRCIEGDNVGSARSDVGVPLDTAPLTTPTIRNMTCITGNTDVNTHGDSEGALARQGGHLLLRELASSTAATARRPTGPRPTSATRSRAPSRSRRRAVARRPSWRATTSSPARKPIKGILANGDELTEWFLGANPSTNGADYSFNAGNFVIADATNANTQVLVPGTFYTAPAIVDAGGATIVADASGLGAVQQADDWTSPWAFGLDPSNADQPLWFAP